jgi:hypothetical protein
MMKTPPPWADGLLRLFVKSDEFESISGDLLEEYREGSRSDVWYARQVLGYATRAVSFWAALFSASFVARTALDWSAPPNDFHTRSTVSTIIGAGILLAAGWRSRSMIAGAAAGMATAGMAAIMSIAGTAGLLAIFHGAAAIDRSGGLAEVFTLPLMMVLPGVVLGSIGGFASALLPRKA